MSFGQAVSSGFSNYATFSGRTPRSGYWWWTLFTILVSLVAAVADSLLGINFEGQNVGFITAIVGLVLLLPSIAVTIRRLHDSGRSGWWWLLPLICGIGSIILFIFCLLDSEPNENKYGPNPKGVAA
jgi:uncharacterized membrane protein YhaH (DUF805 family)